MLHEIIVGEIRYELRYVRGRGWSSVDWAFACRTISVSSLFPQRSNDAADKCDLGHIRWPRTWLRTYVRAATSKKLKVRRLHTDLLTAYYIFTGTQGHLVNLFISPLHLGCLGHPFKIGLPWVWCQRRKQCFAAREGPTWDPVVIF